MKTIRGIVALVLLAFFFASRGVAGDAIPANAKCVFSLSMVASAFHGPVSQKEGVYLYVSQSGLVWGDRYVKGRQVEVFGGTEKFSKRIRTVFKKAAISSVDWDKLIGEISKRVPEDDRIGVADGVTQEIKMDFEGSRCDFFAGNPLAYIRGYSEVDSVMSRLESIVDGIAAGYGHERLDL